MCCTWFAHDSAQATWAYVRVGDGSRRSEEIVKIIELRIRMRLSLLLVWLKWYGHVTGSSGLAKTILQGTLQGGRRRGRQRKRWEDNIKEWTGLEWNIILRKVENREEWRKLVVKSTVVPQRSAWLRDRRSWYDLILITTTTTATTTTTLLLIIIITVFLKRLSMWNMLNCAEQVQIQKYKTHAYKTPQNSRCPNNYARTSN